MYIIWHDSLLGETMWEYGSRCQMEQNTSWQEVEVVGHRLLMDTIIFHFFINLYNSKKEILHWMNWYWMCTLCATIRCEVWSRRKRRLFMILAHNITADLLLDCFWLIFKMYLWLALLLHVHEVSHYKTWPGKCSSWLRYCMVFISCSRHRIWEEELQHKDMVCLSKNCY
jgi:hypothetical protein